MKLMAVMIVALSLITTSWAQGGDTKDGRKSEPMQTVNDIKTVAPALEKYAQGPLAELWQRSRLTPRVRFFGGLRVEETAELLHISPETVLRDWKMAKVW